MTAGTGVTHSEYNPSATERLRFLQIWIWPHSKGLTPGYAEKSFPPHAKRQFIASPDERDGSLLINQDATLERLQLTHGESETLSVDPGRTGMAHVVSGAVNTGQATLSAGDAVITDAGGTLDISVTTDTEMLWFGLP